MTDSCGETDGEIVEVGLNVGILNGNPLERFGGRSAQGDSHPDCCRSILAGVLLPPNGSRRNLSECFIGKHGERILCNNAVKHSRCRASASPISITINDDNSANPVDATDKIFDCAVCGFLCVHALCDVR